MNWIVLSLATAFLTALSALMNKKALRYWSEPVLLLTSSSLLAVLLFSVSGGFDVSQKFYIYLPISVGLHLCASVLNLKALKSDDLSLVFPLINLTPLFMFITSPLIGNEFPRLITIPGILLIVVGAYMLNVKSGDKNFFAPLKALWYSKGARCMCGVAFFWSLAGNVDKLGVLHSSSSVWGASVKTGVALLMLPIVIMKSRSNRKHNVPADTAKRNRSAWIFLLAIPLILSINIICNMEAYKLTLAINVVSVKRLSGLFSVLLAWWVLGEKNIRQRMGAAAVMVAGVLWVGFAP
ncbi:MAG TPA: EamA family transporter [Tichowtungia sp.]|nr:EamA family transporter [Tichowtungia sp.]